jgi:hypothetical protein
MKIMVTAASATAGSSSEQIPQGRRPGVGVATLATATDPMGSDFTPAPAPTAFRDSLVGMNTRTWVGLVWLSKEMH